METKKKFILEFDEEPALIFVSKDGNSRSDELYVNGKKEEGITNIRIDSSVDSFTEYETNKIVHAVKQANKRS